MKVSRYTGPLISFGALRINPNTLYVLTDDSDLYLEGHKDPVLCMPQIENTLRKMSEDTDISPESLWPAHAEEFSSTPKTQAPRPEAPVRVVQVRARQEFKRLDTFAKIPSGGTPESPLNLSLANVPKRKMPANFEVKPWSPAIEDMLRNTRSASGLLKGTRAPSEPIMNIINEVLPRLGLKRMPVQSIIVAESQGPTRIASTSIHGKLFGVVMLNLRELADEGGINTVTVGASLTHEFAHAVENLLRNTERSAYTKALSTRNMLHPRQGQDGYAFGKEQFAILAETMVWGSSARGLYCLNGYDIVSKYFYDNYIPESMREDKSLYL